MILLKAIFRASKDLKTRKNLVFSTKDEINPIELAQITGSEGHLAFHSDPIKKAVEDAMKDSSIGVAYDGKTFSQIFRGVCFSIALKHGF